MIEQKKNLFKLLHDTARIEIISETIGYQNEHFHFSITLSAPQLGEAILTMNLLVYIFDNIEYLANHKQSQFVLMTGGTTL